MNLFRRCYLSLFRIGASSWAVLVGLVRLLQLAPKGEIYLDPGGINYRRYLYALCWFIESEERVVLLPRSLSTMLTLASNTYGRRILIEQRAHFGKPAQAAKQLSISPDYFGSGAGFTIPMSMHPLMYWEGHWNKPVDAPAARRKQAFFAGNFTGWLYRMMPDNGLFPVTDRLTLRSALDEAACITTCATLNDLTATDRPVLLVDTGRLEVPIDTLRPTLAQFSFFLALPGGMMPPAHNIIEALSVGTVPIIEASYAACLKPPITAHEALLWETQEELITLLKSVEEIPQKRITALSAAAQAYYDEHCTPNAVLAKLTALPSGSTLYLQGEQESLIPMRNRP